jgi:tRNA(Arg) A34 adenosine deaminase TadA
MPTRRGAKLMPEENHMRRAIELSLKMMRSGQGGPFGAVIVKDGAILAEGSNLVTSTNDRLRDLHELRALPNVP